MHLKSNYFAIILLMFCCIPSHAQKKEAQKPIEIDLTKTIDSQRNEILVNVTEGNLPDLKLILKGIPADENGDQFIFLGENFTDPGGTINMTKNYDSATKTVEFTLAELKDVTLPGKGNYQYKISYSGKKTLPAVDANKLITPPALTVVKETIFKKFAYSDLKIQEAAKEYVDSIYNPEKYYSDIMGIYIEKNTVHIFIDQNGSLIYTGIPTTAKESYLYQVHLLVEEGTEAKFKFSCYGKYSPKFNIEKTSEGIIKLNFGGVKGKPVIKETEMAKIGPFTDNFTIKLEKITKGADGNDKIEFLLNNKIDVAKLYHVSISTGLLSTTLRNPQNIEKMALPNGKDSTLIADDPNKRGILTIMATFYPKGRSFLFPPSGSIFDPSRFGVQVGAQLNDKISENFFLGLSHDFARGGSISYGAHFGRRNYVAGKRNFNFGKELFDLPDLNVKKEWAVGFYFGVVIDTRVAIELLKGLGNSN